MLINRIISEINNFRYKLTEPIKLNLARRSWRHKYNPLISVYIPTYNRPELLVERGIKSVLKQTYNNFELIVVDDGSKHPLRFFSHPQVKIYHLPPRRKRLKDKKDRWLVGPTRAANVALSLCGGDWIARNDDDDIWTKDHLESLLRFAQQGDYEFVSACQLWEAPEYVELKTWQDDMGIDAKIGGIQTTLYRSYLKCFNFNKHCWRKNWNANNDLDLLVRMYKAGVRMAFLNKVVAVIKPRPGEKEIGLKAIIKE